MEEVKRGRGRPKGSKNKPKVAVKGLDTAVPEVIVENVGKK